MNTMKFLIIGCGSIGRRHLINVLTIGHKALIYNRGKERRLAVQKEFDVPVYADLHEMLEMEDADAAIIATPNHIHIQHALMAARKGLNLFIEKPLSNSIKGIKEFKREIQNKGLLTHIGCNMRFHFGPALIKKKLEEGILGRPLWAGYWAGMHLPDWHPWEDYRQMYSANKEYGGGAVLDFIHELDMALWFFPGPKRVAAMTARSEWLEIDTEDIVDIVLGYQNGFQVNIHLDYLQKPYQRGIRVVGTEGWANWDLGKKGVEIYDYKTGETEWYPYPEGYDHNTMFMEQMKYFIHCLEKNTSSMSDLEAGIKALDLAIKVKKSDRESLFIEMDEIGGAGSL